jgi:hypothetical protein
MSKEHWNGGTGGKGSKARLFSVTQEEYDNRWDLIFGKDKPEEDKKETIPMPGTIGGAKITFKDEQ